MNKFMYLTIVLKFELHIFVIGPTILYEKKIALFQSSDAFRRIVQF